MAHPTDPDRPDDLEPVFDPFDALAGSDPWLDGFDGLDPELGADEDEAEVDELRPV